MLKKILKYLLMLSGNYNYHIDKKLFKNFIDKIFVYDCGYKLIRIGNEFDGGYLIPDVLQEIKYCFSGGVGDNYTFEQDLKKRSIKCFLADGTIEPVEGFEFVGKNINCFNDKNNITINEWISKSIDLKNEGILLKLDIEGSEISTIYNIDEKYFEYIKVIVIEFHDFVYLGSHFGNKILDEVFSKIFKNFTICHVHPNNYGSFRNIEGIKIPNLMEFTFLNNDLIKDKKKIDYDFPHLLDSKNNPHKNDIVLPKIFYK